MKINKLFSAVLAVVALLACAVSAQAQIGGAQTPVYSSSGEWWAAITNNTVCASTNSIIDCSRGKSLALSWTAELSAAGTTANTLVTELSGDRINWVAGPKISLTPAGTAATTALTNMTMDAYNWMRIRWITNASGNTGYVTNYTVKAYVK